MSRRSNSPVKRYHDRVARRYDAMYDDVYWRFHDSLTWDYIKPHLPSDLSLPIMDAGCGTAKWAVKFLDCGYRVTCVDISGAMIETARKKIDEKGKSDRASFIQADLCDLTAVSDSTYGLIVALGDPVGCTTHPAKALKQLRKKLTPDGVLILTLDNRFAAMQYYLERGAFKELAEFVSNGKTHWLTRDREEQFEIHTYGPEQAVRLLQRSGFEVMEIIGKTVLDVRAFRDRLDDPDAYRAMMQIEKKLSRQRDAVGRAGHLQIAAKPQAKP